MLHICRNALYHLPFLSLHRIRVFGLNKDLKTINERTFQWKMSFNPNPNNQSQGIIFTRKSINIRHPPLIFNNSKIFQSTTQKHLGLIIGYHSKNI